MRRAHLMQRTPGCPTLLIGPIRSSRMVGVLRADRLGVQPPGQTSCTSNPGCVADQTPADSKPADSILCTCDRFPAHYQEVVLPLRVHNLITSCTIMPTSCTPPPSRRLYDPDTTWPGSTELYIGWQGGTRDYQCSPL